MICNLVFEEDASFYYRLFIAEMIEEDSISVAAMEQESVSLGSDV